jgi:hypothetical protein
MPQQIKPSAQQWLRSSQQKNPSAQQPTVFPQQSAQGS